MALWTLQFHGVTGLDNRPQEYIYCRNEIYILFNENFCGLKISENPYIYWELQ